MTPVPLPTTAPLDPSSAMATGVGLYNSFASIVPWLIGLSVGFALLRFMSSRKAK